MKSIPIRPDIPPEKRGRRNKTKPQGMQLLFRRVEGCARIGVRRRGIGVRSAYIPEICNGRGKKEGRGEGGCQV